MAEILIRKHDIDADNEAGDIVFVAPDGHKWGRRESRTEWLAQKLDPKLYPDDFLIVKVPNVTPAQFNANLELMGKQEETKHKIDIKNFKKADKDKLSKDEKIDVAANKIDKQIVIKISKEKRMKDAYDASPEGIAKKAEKAAAKADAKNKVKNGS